MKCPHCDTPIDEHPANLCLNQWVAVEVMDGRLENYSATIAAAWEVVEHLRHQWALGIWMYPLISSMSPHSYVVAFEENVRPPCLHVVRYVPNAHADELPIAICRAALKAVHETQTA